MNKVTVVQVVYNSKRFIELVFNAVFNQTYKDFHFVAIISGNDDNGKELIAQKFPQVEIIDPCYNIGFAKGHNLVFENYDSEFFQLVNPDLIMAPDYIERILRAFDDPKVGAATGKLLKYDFEKNQKTNIIDSTGVVINKSGRARDRGQHEVDKGQYDKSISVQAVSGAGAMFRKSALEAVKYQKEYFDEDFHSYWEDVDLTWRMANAGWKSIFVPGAVAFHGRSAASTPGGYMNVIDFIRRHRQLSPQIRRLNYKNHILMYVKNSPWPYPQFFIREFFMLFYVLFFEIGTLAILPELFRQVPRIIRKRKNDRS